MAVSQKSNEIALFPPLPTTTLITRVRFPSPAPLSHSDSNSADPLPVFPNRFERSQIARVKDVLGGGEEMAALRGLPRVAGVDGHALEHARVAVAVNHAARAAVADEFRL